MKNGSGKSQNDQLAAANTPQFTADRDALTARLAALALSDAAMRLSLQGPESCEITDSWVNYEQADGALRALAVYEIQANAAVARQGLQGG